MRATAAFLLLLATVATPAPAAEESGIARPPAVEHIVLCFEDTDVLPWRTRRKTGLNFVLLDAVAASAGVRFEYHGRPWRRCQDDLREGRVDGSFGMSFTPERAAFVVYPPGTSIVQDLRRRGYAVDDGAAGPPAVLRKLASGRLGAAAIGTDQMNQQWAAGGDWLQALEVLPIPLVDKPYFLVFSRSFAARRPDLAERLWAAIAEQRESEAYEAALHHSRGADAH